VGVGAAALIAGTGLLAAPAVANPTSPQPAEKGWSASAARRAPAILAHPGGRLDNAGSRRETTADRTFFTTGGYQFITTDGTRAVVTVAKPYLDRSDFSTSAGIQIATADEQQAIYFGWQVDRSYGDTEPHLFVFTWVDGTEACYNECGFVQTSSTHVLGEALQLGAHEFAVQHVDGRWWASIDKKRVGYFPDSFWSGRFTSAGLNLWGGEVEVTSASAPCTDLGNGRPAASRRAASAENISYFNGEAVNFATHATNPDFYSIRAVNPTKLRFGGPGAC
jgi:hypothetical protein